MIIGVASGKGGTGKTTLAMVIANQTQSHFETLSAVLDGKQRLREVVDEAIDGAEGKPAPARDQGSGFGVGVGVAGATVVVHELHMPAQQPVMAA